MVARGRHPARHVSACYYDKLSAGLDANGKPVAWTHRIVGSSVLARFAPPAVKDGVDPDAVDVASEIFPMICPTSSSITCGSNRMTCPPRSGAAWDRRAVRSSSKASSMNWRFRPKADPVEYRRALLGKSPRARNVLDWPRHKRPAGDSNRCRKDKGAASRSCTGSAASSLDRRGCHGRQGRRGEGEPYRVSRSIAAWS